MTNLRSTVTLIAFAIAGLSRAAAADPSAHLSKISMAEGSAAFVDVNSIGGPRALDEALAKMQRCVKAVDTATQAGVPATTETKVDDSKTYKSGRRVKKPGYTAKHYAPIGEIRTGCQAKFAKLRVLPVTWAIDDVKRYVDALRQRSKPDRHAHIPAQLAYDKCIKAVDKTVALGTPPQTSIATKTLTVSLSEAKDKGCGIALAAIAESKKKADGANAAKFAPYKRALRGDKWRTFKRKNMIHFRVYGPGGRVLSTPRALAKAGVWFEPLRTGRYRQWALRRYKFNRKNRLVSTRTITGRGRIPPSRAYR